MENTPKRCSEDSQCALKTTIPFGVYFFNKAGPKSSRKAARGPFGPEAVLDWDCEERGAMCEEESGYVVGGRRK
jgi:hypothetical protein